MKIVLIGSGNVAWNLGRLFVHHKHEVVQIISRNAQTATELAYELNTESANYFSIINKQADIYIITVNDDAIDNIANELLGLNKLVVHTSGAMNMDILAKCTNTYGVLYPLQSLVYGAKELPEIPFLIQGNTNEVKNKLTEFAATLSPQVLKISDEEKIELHVAAVFVNNFTNHLYVLAQQWCKEHNLDFSLLLPLIKETTDRVLAEKNNPNMRLRDLQTGPAIRNDKVAIAKHKELLKAHPYMLSLYELMTNGITQNTHT
jgi:predicted short-subunit dehydrogenase-like oxidoreductase (DUF2520 family)